MLSEKVKYFTQNYLKGESIKHFKGNFVISFESGKKALIDNKVVDFLVKKSDVECFLFVLKVISKAQDIIIEIKGEDVSIETDKGIVIVEKDKFLEFLQDSQSWLREVV